MPKLNQRGVVQFIVLAILVLGLIAGVYLVQQTQIFKPKAGGGVSGPIIPTTSFTLIPSKGSYQVGEEVAVQIVVHSDVTATNLFDAKVNFDPTALQLGRVDVTSHFITNWIEQYWGDPGKVSLIGGKPSPGYLTQASDSGGTMATLYFIALKSGNTTISFDNASAIYSNGDNLDVLVSKPSVTIVLASSTQPTSSPSVSPTPIPSPSVSPSPSASPTPNSGDGNGDGKVNLVDLSILLSDFNKTSGFRSGIDLNGDGKINVFDFSAMRSLLIQKGIIRG